MQNIEMKIDGKKVAKAIKESISKKLENEEKAPKLVIITCGDDPASKVYVRNKIKAGKECGIFVDHFTIDGETTKESENLLEHYINKFNYDASVDGIIVQLPLPKGINEEKIVNLIAPEKDVDGLSVINIGKNLSKSKQDHFKPCTPSGIIQIIKASGLEESVRNKNVAIFGRSNLVGLPIAIMMMNEFNCTPTIYHSKSKVNKDALYNSDIIISAIGQANHFNAKEDFNENAIVIDVGINRDENGKLCGDVYFSDDAIVKAYTPVPGGVGPMTVAMLMKNTYLSFERKNK